MDRTQGQTADPAERSGSTPAAPARIVTLTAGDFSLTVNPVDGSEIEPHRPGADTGRRPAKRAAAARRAREAGARPPALPGQPVPGRLPPAREEERERLVRLLGRGRSVRLTGPAGSGRTTLLDAVATACADLAPDGVVRLSGYGHQQPAELLHALHAAVYEAPEDRPDRIELLSRVRDIGAVVLLDDLEMGGSALDELLRATPECAYLLATTPDTRAPSDDSHLEEVFLSGLGKAECLDLLEARAGRPLTDEETAWAGDLRFASEGLPLRFVQAAALLRQRDELNRADEDDDEEEPGVFEGRPRDAVEVPLPTLAEGAAPAELLASRVSESARAALRIACALGGELPHHAHLPALVGDTHADTAVAELLACGLLTPVGARYRLAAGVARQLEDVGYGDTAAEEARTAARHYAWWTGHASVTPERVGAEAEAVLAALAGADVVAAVLLARTAAPAFAASLHWEAWERVLRSGAEAARKAGEVAEQAYFHHELGVLALCEGRLDRARAELETSIGLRGALADKRGTIAGRRALALVVDRESAEVAASPPLRLEAPAALPAGTGAGTGAGAGAAAVTAALPAGTGAGGTAGAGTGMGTGAGTGATSGATAGAGGVPAASAAAAAVAAAVAGAGGAARTAAATGSAAATEAAAGAAGTGAATGPAATGLAATGPAGTGAAAGPAGAPAAGRAPAAVTPAAGLAKGPGTPAAPVDGAAREPSEAVTRLTPVVPVARRSAPPTTLSEVFEEAFPLTPKEPAAAATARVPVPVPGPRAGRRRVLLLAGAGALAVVTLGTVVALALSSSDAPSPAKEGPAVSTSPTAPPAVLPGTSGHDPATTPPAEPAAPAESTAPGESVVPGETLAPAPGRTPARTPSQRPSTTPPKTTPPPATTAPTPSPEPTATAESPTPSVTPTATVAPTTDPLPPGTG
ncbi:ATP-binding protein [Streptomyces antarcticus]|uniref:ATP-binding protein n=2 Tax=Streptomyces antarcticus TaxID=2996458 RepID=UPI00226E2714|nr:ATP-binding protein [Streptomyces sp. H34-AA3]MCY0940074.1 ATP-binding protein [Streptomyces sp. H34-AA3]